MGGSLGIFYVLQKVLCWPLSHVQLESDIMLSYESGETISHPLRALVRERGGFTMALVCLAA